jgi:hypothetical protein
MTRADAFVNFAYAVTLLAPCTALVSFRLARRRRHEVHRAIQIALVGVCVLAVLVLEARIRLEGGSGAFIAQAPEALRTWARRLLLIHIGFAVATYIAWATLAVLSWRRFAVRLPGAFSRNHRRIGWAVFAGLCFTAVSATGMYVLVFTSPAR